MVASMFARLVTSVRRRMESTLSLQTVPARASTGSFPGRSAALAAATAWPVEVLGSSSCRMVLRARAGVLATSTRAPHTSRCRARLSCSPSSEHRTGEQQWRDLAGVRRMKGPVLLFRKARHFSRCWEMGTEVQQSRRRQELRKLGKTREEEVVLLEETTLHWVERRGRR